jgi:predicted dithiol-disulfide oxidoreductase (DUF899 family)
MEAMSRRKYNRCLEEYDKAANAAYEKRKELVRVDANVSKWRRRLNNVAVQEPDGRITYDRNL